MTLHSVSTKSYLVFGKNSIDKTAYVIRGRLKSNADLPFDFAGVAGHQPRVDHGQVKGDLAGRVRGDVTFGLEPIDAVTQAGQDWREAATDLGGRTYTGSAKG